MPRQPITPPPPTVEPLLRPSARRPVGPGRAADGPGGPDGFDEPTPTTRPSWGPPPPVRLARGTLSPPGRPGPIDPPAQSDAAMALAVACGLAIEPPASRPAQSARPQVTPDLAVRVIETPRRWGHVERVPLHALPLHTRVAPPAIFDLDGATTPFVRTRISLLDATDGAPTVRRGIPWPAIGAGVAALAVLIVMAAAVSGGGSKPTADPAAPIVTQLPASPAPALAVVGGDDPAAAHARAADLDVFGVEDPVDPAAAPVPALAADPPELDVFGVVDPAPVAPAADPAPIEMDVMDLARPAPVPPAAARPSRPSVLMVSAKPPCRIVVDGRDTGLTTPQRGLRLAPGRHVVTLVNDEHGIRDRSTVTVPAGGAVKLIRDLTEHML